MAAIQYVDKSDCSDQIKIHVNLFVWAQGFQTCINKNDFHRDWHMRNQLWNNNYNDRLHSLISLKQGHLESATTHVPKVFFSYTRTLSYYMNMMDIKCIMNGQHSSTNVGGANLQKKRHKNSYTSNRQESVESDSSGRNGNIAEKRVQRRRQFIYMSYVLIVTHNCHAKLRPQTSYSIL